MFNVGALNPLNLNVSVTDFKNIKVGEGIGKLGDGLGSLGGKLGDGIGSIGGKIGDLKNINIGDGIGKLGDGIGSLGGKLGDGIGSIGGKLGDGFGQLGDGIGSIGGKLGDGFGQIGELTGIKKKHITRGNLTEADKLKPNPNFKHYKDIMENLIKQTTVKTEHPLISMDISYDSTKAIAVTKESDQCSCIKMYGLEEPHVLTFSETIHGTYIKLKEVEQNDEGSLFCIGYSDDGYFRVRIFTQEERTEE